VLARNPYNADFWGAWRSRTRARAGFATGDRLEFLGRNGSLRRPAALAREALGQRFGAGLDPCAAFRFASISSPARRGRSCCCWARGDDRAHALALAGRFGSREAARSALEQVEQRWDAVLGTVQVETPDDSFDLIMNRWLLYQAVSSRLWGRTDSSSRAARTASGTSSRT
jgi:cyclic beta-1,2-glucan synthetase